jgi:hydroxyacid-oxoacid transhydrogenase
VDHALVPHGLSVIVSAPAVFSWTAVACPERHERVAQILQSARWQREGKARSTSTKQESSDIGLWLADEIRDLCHCLDVNLGLRQFGYNEEDIPDLVDGTIQQHRVTKISPRHVKRADLEGLFLKALQE